jgi:hypothetical protein
LHLAFDLIGFAFTFGLGVAGYLARHFLDFAFGLLGRAFDAIFIDHFAAPSLLIAKRCPPADVSSSGMQIAAPAVRHKFSISVQRTCMRHEKRLWHGTILGRLQPMASLEVGEIDELPSPSRTASGQATAPMSGRLGIDFVSCGVITVRLIRKEL